MRSMYDISATEKEVFEMLWKYPEGINQTELLELFISEGKTWKRQTLNTYLSNLEDKGLIQRKKRTIWPLYTESEYNNLQMQEAIEKMYNGKLSNFVVAFTKGKDITDDEVDYLIKILNDYKDRKGI